MQRQKLAIAVPYVALALAVGLFPLLARNPYLQSVGALTGLYAIIALGLCLLMGYAGQVSLGQAAFYGLGAYSSAILTTRVHLNPWLGIVAGVIITCAVAFVVGRPTLRLHGHHLAMATLGFGIIVQVVLDEALPLTGGHGGLPGIPRLQLAGAVIQSDLQCFYLIWVVALAALILSANVVNSRVGRALRAIHDSEVAARACGIDVAHYKLMVFILGAALASVAGSLYAHYITFVSPDTFGLAFSVQLVVMVVVGGLRSIWGAVLGAAVITVIGQAIEKTEAIKDLNTVVFGLALMLCVMFMPNGLVAVVERAAMAVRRVVGGRSGV